jgi:hypothetical protein
MKEPTSQAFVREYRDDVTKKVTSRWHYNYAITKHGPILVEEFGLPPKEKKSRTKKKVAEE